MRTVKIVAIFLFFISVNLCFSQVLHNYGLKIGTVASSQDWTFSSSVNTSSVNIKQRWGIDFGGFIEWLDSPCFTILTELHYIQKGFSSETIANNQTVTSSSDPRNPSMYQVTAYAIPIRVDYLSIPILAKLSFPVEYVAPYLILGARIDFHLKTISDTDKRGTYALCDQTDYGFTLGGGVTSNSLLPFRVGAEFRYSPSLQNLSNSDLSTIKNKSIEILLVISP